MLPSAVENPQHRARITFHKLACLVLLANVSLTEALAQIDPDDTGEGVRLGMSQEHNSGQTGTVTLLERGPARTLVIARVASAPASRPEIAEIARARACRSPDPTAVFPLHAGAAGQFRGIVTLAAARLLSGNYIVEVFARPGGVRVSCGALYR